MARVTVAPVAGSYDLAHLPAFRREIFGGLYDWAGEIRTVAIAKSQLFCLPQHIEGYATDVFTGLRHHDLLRGRSRAEFLDGAAELWADVNALHPFREGNGRSTRAFLDQLSADAGWPVTWKHLDPDANVAAAVASMNGDNTGLRRLLEERTPILGAAARKQQAGGGHTH